MIRVYVCATRSAVHNMTTDTISQSATGLLNWGEEGQWYGYLLRNHARQTTTVHRITVSWHPVLPLQHLNTDYWEVVNRTILCQLRRRGTIMWLTFTQSCMAEDRSVSITWATPYMYITTTALEYRVFNRTVPLWSLNWGEEGLYYDYLLHNHAWQTIAVHRISLSWRPVLPLQ